MSRQRKRDAVLRLLRGEDLEMLSRALSVTAATLTTWRDRQGSSWRSAGVQPLQNAHRGVIRRGTGSQACRAMKAALARPISRGETSSAVRRVPWSNESGAMKRRSFLFGGLGAAGGNEFLRGPSPVHAADTAVVLLSAEIEINGRTYRYQEANARDLGDYIDPQGRFVQTCRMASDSGLPMTVLFRRDRGSDRAEVVFELGRCWSGEPAHLGAIAPEFFVGRWRLLSSMFLSTTGSRVGAGCPH